MSPTIADLATLELDGAVRERLVRAGYDTPLLLMTTSPAELARDCEISLEAAEGLVQRAAGCVQSHGFRSSDEILAERQARPRLRTGCLPLDALLGGGVETGAITEAAGEFGTGKTHLALQLAVAATRPRHEGGLGGTVLFIDSENTFRPERLSAIAEGQGIDPAAVRRRVFCERATSSAHQMALVRYAFKERMREPVRLLIVDSLTAHFKVDYVGRDVIDRQQQLNRHLRDLQEFAIRHEAAVYVSNQVHGEARGVNTYGDSNAPSGGHIVAHGTTHRLYLSKQRDGRRRLRLIDSPDRPEGECILRITEAGLRE